MTFLEFLQNDIVRVVSLSYLVYILHISLVTIGLEFSREKRNRGSVSISLLYLLRVFSTPITVMVLQTGRYILALIAIIIILGVEFVRALIELSPRKIEDIPSPCGNDWFEAEEAFFTAITDFFKHLFTSEIFKL